MNPLTKDQIEQLTPEQQATIASLELNRFRKHQQLLKGAQSYLGRYACGPVGSMIALVAYGVSSTLAHRTATLDYTPIICILLLATVVAVHIVGLNNRIDALLELLDKDLKKSADHGERSH